MPRLSVSTLLDRIDFAELERDYLVALRGSKTRRQVNRLDTVRKKLLRLWLLLARDPQR